MRACPRCRRALPGEAWACSECGWAAGIAEGIPVLAPELTGDNPAYDPAHYAQLARLEQGSAWFHSRNQLIGWAFAKHQPDARSILEIGCGTGYVLQALARQAPAARLVGADVLVEGLRYARERVPEAEFIQLDATRMPFESEFDAVGAFDVLEHIEEDGLALAAIHRSLQPGGILVLTVPSQAFLWSASDELAGHVRRYTRRGLGSRARAAGFEVELLTSFVSLLLPALLASRRSRSEPTIYQELECAGWQNSLLGGSLAVERGLIQRGVRLPIGGSLLLVARKTGAAP